MPVSLQPQTATRLNQHGPAEHTSPEGNQIQTDCETRGPEAGRECTARQMFSTSKTDRGSRSARGRGEWCAAPRPSHYFFRVGRARDPGKPVQGVSRIIVLPQ
jgi:hypothetical protein